MDELTLNKILELLNGAKDRIQKIEMKATSNNVSAVAEAINLIQIVCNTVVIELKEGKKDDAKPNV